MFKKEQMILIGNCVGKKVLNIFYQPTAGLLSEENMFVINFGLTNVEYSLHAFTFVRFRDAKQLLLTSADEYFKADYKKISEADYALDDRLSKSLIAKRIRSTKKLLTKAVVASVRVEDWGDIVINFDNGIVLEVFIDASYQGFEYYRFIEFNKKPSVTYVVGFDNRQLVSKVVVED